MPNYNNQEIEAQVSQCVTLLKEIFAQDLLGIYLYGSMIVGGLQQFSDLDLFVVIDRASTDAERIKLVTSLLQISGVYAQSSKPPIEMTIVVKLEINPWHYPPRFDFQYGDWLRADFEKGNVNPWVSKEMPDLALLITQVLLAHKVLFGVDADKLLCNVPYCDFLAATKSALAGLEAELFSDTRNVLLTYARIWRTVETDTICSKPEAAVWAINRLPEIYKPVMQRAYGVCIGVEEEYWEDLRGLVPSVADYMVGEIGRLIGVIEASDLAHRVIKNS